MHKTVAKVFYGDAFAGLLEKTEGEASTSFTYDKAYLADGFQIAYGLPLQEEPFITEGLHPFFDSMVSEGWLKKQQAQTQKISPENRFLLLINNGDDLPGMVSIQPFVDGMNGN